MGKEIRENLFSEVAKLYQTLDEGLLPISVFFPYLPIPAHKRYTHTHTHTHQVTFSCVLPTSEAHACSANHTWSRRDEARLAMVRLFKKIIDERRANPEVKHNDCLQVFMDARYRGEDQALNDEEITGASAHTYIRIHTFSLFHQRLDSLAEFVGLMIALLFAGQHTSSVTGSWTGLLLFEANNKKKFLPGVLEEQEVRWPPPPPNPPYNAGSRHLTMSVCM
jgi:sterol 14-demethylase